MSGGQVLLAWLGLSAVVSPLVGWSLHRSSGARPADTAAPAPAPPVVTAPRVIPGPAAGLPVA